MSFIRHHGNSQLLTRERLKKMIVRVNKTRYSAFDKIGGKRKKLLSKFLISMFPETWNVALYNELVTFLITTFFQVSTEARHQGIAMR